MWEEESRPVKLPITLDFQYPDVLATKWHSCPFCGGDAKKVELRFDAGSTPPAIGDKLIGETSGNYGTVESIESPLLSGSWAGGNAAGYIHLTNCSVVDENLQIFTDNEHIHTTNIQGVYNFTANGKGNEKNYSILYPLNQMIYYLGRWYCREHFRWYWDPRKRDEVRITIDERDRGIWR